MEVAVQLLSASPAGCVSVHVLPLLVEQYILPPFTPAIIFVPSELVEDINQFFAASPAGRVSVHASPLFVEIYNLPFHTPAIRVVPSELMDVVTQA
jgi:hypothetical protein